MKLTTEQYLFEDLQAMLTALKNKTTGNSYFNYSSSFKVFKDGD